MSNQRKVGSKYSFLLVARLASLAFLKPKAVRSIEASTNFFKITPRHIPEDRTLQELTNYLSYL
jgi:hypothetical protein